MSLQHMNENAEKKPKWIRQNLTNRNPCENTQKQGIHFDKSDRENVQTSENHCDFVESNCRFSFILSMGFAASFHYALSTFCRGI